MRVTDNMISGQVVFNMQRSLRRFFQLETQTSSGRRINKPSDDPTGTLRDLNYRSELSHIEQLRKNIGQALNWTGTYDQTLADVKDFVSTAKEIAVAMANDTYDDVARQASASEIESILEQIMTLANGKLESRSIFAGNLTRITPFEMAANGVVYRGDQGRIQFEVDAAQRLPVNLPGSSVFLQQVHTPGENADLNVGVTPTTLLADLHAGTGIDQAVGTFVISDLNLGLSSTVDVSGATTMDDVITAINTQLAADGITNMTARIGDDGNNIFLDTTENGLITGQTSVSRLNQGSGIDLQPGKLRVTNGTSIDVTVDLSSAATIDDIINEFNSQLTGAGVAGVSMSINAAGTGLQLDDTNVPPLNLTMSDISEFDQTASDLGLNGPIGSQLIGADLNPGVAFEIAETSGTTAADLGLRGVIYNDFAGGDLNPQLTVDSALASLRNGQGLAEGTIVIHQGERRLSIDLSDPLLVTVQDFLDRINGSSLDLTASLNPDGTGIQIINNDPTRSLTIEDDGNGRAAKDLGIYGSSDMMGTLLVLAHALENDDGEGAGILLEHLDASIQSVLDVRSDIGTRAIRLETTDNRLQDMELNFTKLLSEVEDADLADVLSKLSTHEANYQAALMAGAKIIQPSLLDFLSR